MGIYTKFFSPEAKLKREQLKMFLAPPTVPTKMLWKQRTGVDVPVGIRTEGQLVNALKNWSELGPPRRMQPIYRIEDGRKVEDEIPESQLADRVFGTVATKTGYKQINDSFGNTWRLGKTSAPPAPIKPDAATANIRTFEAFEYGKDVPEYRGTPEYQAKYMDFYKRKQQLSSEAEAAKEMSKAGRMNMAFKWGQQFNQLENTKNFYEIENHYEGINEAYSESLVSKNLAGVDQAMIMLYNKMLDPESVVRESEYARTAENLPFLNRFMGAFVKLKAGGAGLTDDDRQALLTMARRLYNVRQRKMNDSLKLYQSYIKELGLKPEGYLNPAIGQPAPTGAAPGGQPEYVQDASGKIVKRARK